MEIESGSGESLSIQPPKLPDIQFIPTDLGNALNPDNVVGDLIVKIPLKKNIIRGMAVSNEELYIVFGESSDIDVYDTDGFAYQRTITVNELVNACDMIAHAGVLYVSETSNELIHRIQMPDVTCSNWHVNSKFLKVTMNKHTNLIVSCYDSNLIREYSTSTGTLLREIKVDTLDGSTAGLLHAIQLDNDQFLICHASTEKHRVCLIDTNGGLMKSYGCEPGAEAGHLNWACYLAIDKLGYILVADCYNNRIIQLNPSLEFVRNYVGLKQPLRMHLQDKKPGRLYISEMNEGSLFIFSEYYSN